MSAGSNENTVTFQEQLARVVACLSLCHNLKSVTLGNSLDCRGGMFGSGVEVWRILAQRAKELEDLRIHHDWVALDGLQYLVSVLRATRCLKRLDIEGSVPRLRLRRGRHMPLLPPLPVLTGLYIPTAQCITATTFTGSDTLKTLSLVQVEAGDLAHVAKCVGHNVKRLDILSLAETCHEDPPPILVALRHLKLPHSATSVRLSSLIDPATQLETLTIYQLSRENLADLREFYGRQPHKTLKRVHILVPVECLWLESEGDYWVSELSLEAEKPIREWQLRKLASRRLFDRCLVWAAQFGITIQARLCRQQS